MARRNTAPIVSAGPDQDISVVTANLVGTVSDAGLPNPPGTVTTTWNKVSGPGTVTFANANALTTTATFGALGSYVLRLTASDGQLSASDDVAVAVMALHAPPALFVVASTTLTAADSVLKTRLENLGFVVTVKAATASTTEDATNKTLVLVSPSCAATDVTTKFRDVSVPVIVANGALFRDMGMIGSPTGTHFGTSARQTQISIVSPLHPMAAGLTGMVTVATTKTTFTWAAPHSTAKIVATLASDATKATIFGYKFGDLMTGIKAPARRIGLYLAATTAASFTANGGALFDAAVRWAMPGTRAAPVFTPPEDPSTFGHRPWLPPFTAKSFYQRAGLSPQC
jgi:hypothetical protein